MAGFIVQAVLLAMLATTVGLDRAAWVTGAAYAFVTAALLKRGMSRSGVGAFGPADWVTLARAILVGCVAVVTVASFHRPAPVNLLVSIAAVALLLDAVDGKVARRTATESGFGARFDMEVDSFLVLVLSVFVARSMGAWVLVFGVMRYAFVAAGWAVPWMRGQLPPRYWRKVVAAIQGVVLVFAAADVLPTPLMVFALVAALALLIESFGRDIVWLWHNNVVGPRRRFPAPVAPDGSTPQEPGVRKSMSLLRSALPMEVPGGSSRPPR
jgi:phosphatidylglycerophosphate synthase